MVLVLVLVLVPCVLVLAPWVLVLVLVLGPCVPVLVPGVLETSLQISKWQQFSMTESSQETDHRTAYGKLVMRWVETERCNWRANSLCCIDECVISLDHQLTQDAVLTSSIQHLLVQRNMTEQSRRRDRQRLARFCTHKIIPKITNKLSA